MQTLILAALLGLLCSMPAGAQTSSTEKQTGTTGAVATQYAHGWVVELKTTSFPGAKLTPDPGNVAAYTETGPVFAEETFLKQARLSKGTQVVIGDASAKFASRQEGEYQFGIRIESAKANHCWGKLSLNGTELVQRDVIGVFSAPVVAVSPARLTTGLYDVTVNFGCWTEDPLRDWQRPIESGSVTILVAHPGELAPSPARHGDFLHPFSTRVPAPVAGGPEVIQPSAPLPSPEQVVPHQ
jgi:hypothetical protein